MRLLRYARAYLLVCAASAAASDHAVDPVAVALARFNSGDPEGCVAVLAGAPSRFEVHYLRALCHLTAGSFFAARRFMFLSASYARTPPQIENQRALERTYDERVPLTIRFGVSVLPNTNRSRAPTTESVEIGGLIFRVTERPEQGRDLHVEAGATLRVARRAFPRRALTFFVAGDYEYETLETRRLDRLDGRLRVDLAGPAGIASMSLGARQERLDSTLFKDQRYVTLAGSRSGGSVSVQGQVEYQATDWPFLDARSDGVDLDVALVYGDTLRAGVLAGVGREFSRNFNFNRRRVTCGAIAEYFGASRLGLRATLVAQQTLEDFVDPHPLFGDRFDRETIVELTLIPDRLQIFGLAPRLSLRRERNDSSIDIFSFSRSELRLGVARAF